MLVESSYYKLKQEPEEALQRSTTNKYKITTMSSIQRFLILAVFVSMAMVSCRQNTTEKANQVPVVNVENSEFNNYWYAGKAEVTSYKLEQSRYGEIHEGDAVLIFVTEPFSKSKQVKLDYPGRAGEDKVTVMKLNYVKKFNTGIYPYSMMLSSFTPVSLDQHQNTLKVTASIQEWCGQVFAQMNLNQDNYEVSSYSYFEQEADKTFNVNNGLLEDEIFNRIRLDYRSLPTGKIEVTPSMFFTRLKHENLKPQTAEASLNEQGDVMQYTLDYKKDKRTLKISFQKAFPHQIMSWSEAYPASGGKILTTKATFNESLFVDYWTKNNVADTYLRDSLDLTF